MKQLSDFKGLGPQIEYTFILYWNESKRHYVTLGQIPMTDPEVIFEALQGENWSPNGEAYDFIRTMGADHTSMSIKDRIVYEDGTILEVAPVGFKAVYNF